MMSKKKFVEILDMFVYNYSKANINKFCVCKHSVYRSKTSIWLHLYREPDDKDEEGVYTIHLSFAEKESTCILQMKRYSY